MCRYIYIYSYIIYVKQRKPFLSLQYHQWQAFVLCCASPFIYPAGQGALGVHTLLPVTCFIQPLLPSLANSLMVAALPFLLRVPLWRDDLLDWQNSISRLATFRLQMSTQDWELSVGTPLSMTAAFASIRGTPVANATGQPKDGLAGGGGIARTWVIYQHLHQVAVQGCVSNELQQK